MWLLWLVEPPRLHPISCLVLLSCCIFISIISSPLSSPQVQSSIRSMALIHGHVYRHSTTLCQYMHRFPGKYWRPDRRPSIHRPVMHRGATLDRVTASLASGPFPVVVMLPTRSRCCWRWSWGGGSRNWPCLRRVNEWVSGWVRCDEWVCLSGGWRQVIIPFLCILVPVIHLFVYLPQTDTWQSTHPASHTHLLVSAADGTHLTVDTLLTSKSRRGGGYEATHQQVDDHCTSSSSSSQQWQNLL
jgi:hypothetical protein